MVVRHKGELSHIGRSELRFERSRDAVGDSIDFRREGLPFIVVRRLQDGGSAAALGSNVHLFAQPRSYNDEKFSWCIIVVI